MADSVHSWLFSPLTRPDRCLGALRGDADQAVWDLEDSVDPGLKDAARNTLRDLARTVKDRKPWVHINALRTADASEDIAILEETGLNRVVVPKVDREGVDLLARHPALTEWLLLVETARALYELRREPWSIPPSVSVRLAFGSLDYRLDVGARATDGEEEILWAQSEIVFLSRAYGWPAPIDSVYPHYRDADGLTRAAARARAIGFAGKLAIHPNQIDSIHHAFVPSDEERAWARSVLAAVEDGGGVVGVDGMMADRPVIERARRILRDDGADGSRTS